MKALLILPKKKWRKQDSLIEAFGEYLSHPRRLGRIYGDIKFDTVNIDLPAIEIQSNGVPTEAFIKKITKEYRKDYNIVGVIFPKDSKQKYFGNYYPNTGKDYIMDFYVQADAKDFAAKVKHELSHGAALDVGLTSQGTGTEYIPGADNTHYYFYYAEDKLDEWYGELYAKHMKNVSYFQNVIRLTKEFLAKYK